MPIGFRPELELNDPELETALIELARKEWLKQALEAQIAQFEFAKHCRTTKTVEGIGQCVRRVDAFAFHDWAQKEGSYEVWNDRAFNRYYDNLAPETKPEVVRGKIQVGWDRPVEWFVPFARVTEPKFRKVYADDLR